MLCMLKMMFILVINILFMIIFRQPKKLKSAKYDIVYMM